MPVKVTTKVWPLIDRRLTLTHGTQAVKPRLMVFSTDKLVINIAAAAVPVSWQVDNCRDSKGARTALRISGMELAVIDDGAINDWRLAWLAGQIRWRAPDALVVYIASAHSPEIEKRARSFGADYYTAKPLTMIVR
jgi:hypothetical protein